MFKFVPFDTSHLAVMMTQKINKGLAFTDQQLDSIRSGIAVTGMLGDTPLVSGGIVPIWQGRGQVWTVFNEESKHHFVACFRALRRFLEAAPFTRIEVCVPYHFETGKRRAKMLGFKLECEKAEKYLPDGGDATLYSMVKPAMEVMKVGN